MSTARNTLLFGAALAAATAAVAVDHYNHPVPRAQVGAAPASGGSAPCAAGAPCAAAAPAATKLAPPPPPAPPPAAKLAPPPPPAPPPQTDDG